MTYKDYESRLSEYRESLSSKEWFLDKQIQSLRSAEDFVGHQFSNTIVFVAVFLLGCLSTFLFLKGSQLQSSENENVIFWGKVMHCFIFLTIGLSVFLVSFLKKVTGSSIYLAYIQRNITKAELLDQISQYEQDLLQQLKGIAFTINFNSDQLNSCDPNDIEKINSLTSNLVGYASLLLETQKSLDALHSLQASYIRNDCFDLDIYNAIIEYQK